VVSAWWLLLAFFVGGYAGILLMALMTIARASEPESAGARSRSRRPSVSARPGADSAIDWVI
jgi:hypothetical protein